MQAADQGGRTEKRCMLQVYISNVLDVFEVCCKCFIDILQKQIGWGAHVAMGYTRMFQVYIPNVASVLDV
jgi:hypothetical protein